MMRNVREACCCKRCDCKPSTRRIITLRDEYGAASRVRECSGCNRSESGLDVRGKSASPRIVDGFPDTQRKMPSVLLRAARLIGRAESQ